MSDFWSDCSSTSILHVSERRMLWRACASALVRLRGCAGSPVPSLVAYVISTIISWAGSNNSIFKVPCRINARLFYFYFIFLFLFIYLFIIGLTARQDYFTHFEPSRIENGRSPRKTTWHPQAELGLSHIWPELSSNQQRWDDRAI